MSATENDLLAHTSTGRPDAPHRTLIYGPGGVGKSTFCASCPGVYFLPTEEGANELRVPQWKERIRSLKTLHKALDLLRDGRHPYRAVCLDAADSTEKLLVAEIEDRLAKTAKKGGPRTIAEMNDDYGAGHVALADEWRLLLARFDELREKRDMVALIVAHAKSENVNNLEGKDYTHYTIDLSGRRSAKILINWCDDVLFARQDVSVAAEGKGKLLASASALSLYTRGTAAFEAKTRGEVPWPERLPLDWSTFSRMRELIGRHGKDLAKHLSTRWADVAHTIDEERRSRALAVFESSLRAGQWHLADAVVSQAEDESLTASMTASAEKTRAERELAEASKT